MAKQILATVVGIVIAFGLVAAIEALGHVVYPPPPGLDMTNPEQVSAYVKEMPVGALLFVMAAWALAVLIGGTVASVIGKKPLHAYIIGGLILIASIVNMIMISHPMWFSIASVIAILAMSCLAAGISSCVRPEKA